MFEYLDWVSHIYWQEAVWSIRHKGEGSLTGVILKRILSLIYWSSTQLVKDFSSVWSMVKAKRNDQILYFVSSSNQEKSIRALSDETGGEILGYYSQCNLRYPIGIVNCAALIFLPAVLIFACMMTEHKRKAAISNLDAYATIVPHWLISLLILLYLRPKLVVMSNDHNISNRTVLHQCKRLGITTAYLQHASVTDSFPRLEFDISFLDGEHAYSIYRSIGKINGQVYLVGSLRPRLTQITSRRNAVGVCTNSIDEIGEWREIVSTIVSSGREVVFRWHPTDSRKQQWRNFADMHGVLLSDPAKESVALFLQRVGSVVAGSSNIILDAATAGIPGVIFSGNGKTLDWYGFVRNGVCSAADSFQNLIRLLERDSALSPAEVCKRAAFYDVSLKLNEEWKKERIICEVLQEAGLAAATGAVKIYFCSTTAKAEDKCFVPHLSYHVASL